MKASAQAVAVPAVVAVGPPLAAFAVAAASLAGPGPFAVAVLAVQGLLVAGWCQAGLPDVPRGAEVAVGAGALADVVLLVRTAGPALPLPAVLTGPSVSPLAAVFAAAFAAAVVAGLLPVRRAVAADRHGGVAGDVARAAGTVTLAVLTVLIATLVAERTTTHGALITVAVLVASGLASAARSAVSREPLDVVAALAAAGCAGLLLGWRAAALGPVTATALCLAAGVATVVAHEVVRCATEEESAGSTSAQAPRRGRAARRAAARANRRHGEATLLLTAALPLALTAPAAYLLSRLLVG